MFHVRIHGRGIYQPSAKFLPDDVLSSRPSTPSIRKLGGPSSRPGTPNIPTPTTARGTVALHALHPKQPIQTPQQFYDWFTLIDQSVARSQESHFHAHLETVTSHVEMCDSVLERIELLEREVTDMLDGWRGVEEGGKSLKDACERLLVEKVSFLSISLWNSDLIYGYAVGPPCGDDRGNRATTTVLPRTGVGYQNAEPSWRITRPPSGLLIHGGTR